MKYVPSQGIILQPVVRASAELRDKGFYHGKVMIKVDQFHWISGYAVGHGAERAIAMALRNLADEILKKYPRQYEEPTT